MLEFNEFFNLLENLAPLKLSELSIADGGYDNSGVIVKNGNTVSNVLFTLDLSTLAVKKAKELKVDTIVTHHPAIYYPIKNLSVDNDTCALLSAVKSEMNVISMHLNLDIADCGIDQNLALGLGGKNARILDLVDGVHGYGREFTVDQDLDLFVDRVKDAFETNRVVVYGGGFVKKVASFCGGGGSYALKAVAKNITDADLIVTSDLAHHEIKELVEKGKKVLILPHYVSENYGFKNFYECVKKQLCGCIDAHYFEDKRFM